MVLPVAALAGTAPPEADEPVEEQAARALMVRTSSDPPNDAREKDRARF
jgi:hypothetical protein